MKPEPAPLDLHRIPDATVTTTVCLCFVGDDGESAIIWHIDDDVAVTPDTVRAASAALQRADAVLITFELPTSAVREAIGVSHSGGARVIVQPAPMLANPGCATSLPWDQVDVLVPNEAEARALLGDGQADRAVADGLASALAARLDVSTVVVTLGEAGCVAYEAGVTRRYPAPKAETVDTTGASDAFTATFAAHITAGAPEAEAIRAAQGAAAWAVGHPGGHKSMPRRVEAQPQRLLSVIVTGLPPSSVSLTLRPGAWELSPCHPAERAVGAALREDECAYGLVALGCGADRLR